MKKVAISLFIANIKGKVNASFNGIFDYSRANWFNNEGKALRWSMPMKSILIKFLIFITGLNAHEAFAGHVLPIFTGKFISEYPDDLNQDNCGRLQINYNNTNSDYMEILKKQCNEMPKRYSYIDRCDWESRKIDDSNIIPAEFVQTNNVMDWVEIIKNPNAARPTRMIFSCYQKGGNKKLLMAANAYPIYECPKGSRMTYEYVGNRYVCSTTPNVCLADIVGRDLSTPGLGNLGHTGLTLFPKALSIQTPEYIRTNNNLVLEVLTKEQEPLVINVHTLKSFQEADKYWGIAYGLVGMEFPMKIATGRSILFAGQEQQAFKPDYTIYPLYHEGSDKPGDHGKFRCDTFAYFSYLKGAKHAIDWNWLTPASLFKAFFIPRDDVAAQTNKNQEILIDKIGLQETSQQEIDNFFIGFVENKATSRQEKMSFLMNKLSEFKSNIQYSHFMQLLGYFKPYEYIPDLIGKYKFETNIGKKYEIISTIHDALSIKQEKSWLASNQNIIDGESFLINLMLKEKNPKLLSHAIQSAYIPTTRENYIIVTDAIRRLNSLSDKSYYYTLKQQDMHTIELFLDSKDLQRWQLIKWLAQQTSQDEKLNAYESFVLLIKNGMKPEAIDESVKAPLKAFIMQNKSLVRSDTIFDEAINEAKYQYTLATLTSNSSGERDAYLLRLIGNEKNDVTQAKYIYGISYLINDNKVLNLLTEKERSQIIEKFRLKFGHVNDPERMQLFTSIAGALR